MAQRPAAWFQDLPDYGARDFRHMWEPLKEGVLNRIGFFNDLQVVAGATGLSVDVQPGVGYVEGDTSTDFPLSQQGLYRVWNDGTMNSGVFDTGPMAAAHATNPRLDQIVCNLYDADEGDGSGEKGYHFQVIPGTASAGATLANRTGAATLPGTCMRLADVLVPAAATSIVAANIRDRRPWARGFHWFNWLQSGADYSITNTSFAALDATNLQVRGEFGSVGFVRARLVIESWSFATAGQFATVQLRDNGASAEGSQGFVLTAPVAGHNNPAALTWVLPNLNGSHLLTPYIKVNAGTLTIDRGTDYGVSFEVEEVAIPSFSNGLT